MACGDGLLLEFLPHKMTVNVNVFGAFMKLWIVVNVYGRLVVTA